VRVGSLFSGIGGIDLGLERAGMTVIWQSEIEPYACRVLAKHWPDVPNLGDVKRIDWSTVERPDLICGGYPCQPFSVAGQRGGAGDPRHLWPDYRDALRVLRPRWAVLENVPGHLSLGFGRVLGDLADLGYDCEWDCISAAAVGAPHLRFRVFVVAHTDDPGCLEQRSTGPAPAALAAAERGGDVPDAGGEVVWQQPDSDAGRHGAPVARDDGEPGPVADAEELPVGTGLRPSEPGGQRRGRPGDGGGSAIVADSDLGRGTTGEAVSGDGGPLSEEGEQRLIRRGGGRSALSGGRSAAGPDWWAVEPDVGRVADGVPARVDRLRALGNAVVPQVAEWIGHRIMAVDG
jgi:DNA (cytosine-5)-methyltransferase 1